MAEVGLGQLVTTTGRARSRKLKDNVKDNLPVTAAMKAEGGIKYKDGGRTVVEEFASQQNSTVQWVGESGQVSVGDSPVTDSAEFDWKYQLGSVAWTLAERYKNSGGSDTKLIDVVAAKFQVLESSMMNEYHEGILSDGTGVGGLQLGGLAALVAKIPTVGTVGGIVRSNADAAFYRNYKFATATDWTEGAASAGNIKRLYDKAINNTTRGLDKVSLGLAGTTHWEFLSQSLQAIQRITEDSGTGKAGFDKLVYRGVPIYFGGGISFSGNTLVQADLTYFLNVKPGYLNLVYHDKGEFEMLEPVNSRDQAAVSRLMFSMSTMVLGFAKGQAVVFDS